LIKAIFKQADLLFKGGFRNNNHLITNLLDGQLDEINCKETGVGAARFAVRPVLRKRAEL